MAFRIIPPSTGVVEAQKPQQSESLGGKALRNVARTATNIAGIPGNVLSGIQSASKYLMGDQTQPKEYSSGPLGDVEKILDQGPKLGSGNLGTVNVPTSDEIGNFLEDKLGLEKGYLKPKGTIEEAADMTVQNLPLVYFFGGAPLGQKVLADFAGSLGSKVAEKSGAGPMGQFISSILASGGSNKVVNFFKKGGNPNSLTNLAKEAEKSLFMKAEKAGEKINAPANTLRSKINKLGQQVADTSALKPDEQKDLLSKFAKYEGDLASGKINANKLVARNQELNSAWDATQRSSKEYQRYIRQTQGILLDELANIGEHHPQWFKDYNAAKSVTQALNFGSNFMQQLNEYPKIQKFVSNPLIQSLFGISGGGLLGGAPAAIAGAAGVGIAKKGTQVIGFLKGSPTTRRIFADAVKASLENNIPRLTQSLSLLNKEAKKYEQVIEKQSKPFKSGRFNIIPPK